MTIILLIFEHVFVMGFGELEDSNTVIYDEYECINEYGDRIFAMNQN